MISLKSLGAINSKVDKTTQDAKDSAQDASINGLADRVTALENIGGGIISKEVYGLPDTTFFEKNITVSWGILTFTVGSGNRYVHNLTKTDVADALYYDTSADEFKRCVTSSYIATKGYNFSKNYYSNISSKALEDMKKLLLGKTVYQLIDGQAIRRVDNVSGRLALDVQDDFVCLTSYVTVSDGVITKVSDVYLYKSTNASVSFNQSTITLKPTWFDDGYTVLFDEDPFKDMPSTYKLVADLT